MEEFMGTNQWEDPGKGGWITYEDGKIYGITIEEVDHLTRDRQLWN